MIRRLQILLLLFFCSCFVYSQETYSSSTNTDTDTAAYVVAPKINQFQKPVFRGFSAHFDIATPIIGLLSSSTDIYSFEGQVDVNLFDRLFPIVEVGYASVIKTLDAGSKYQSHSPYFRIGLNYSLFKVYDEEGNAKVIKNYPFIGIRYAIAPMNYMMDDITISDDYWGGEEYRNYSELLNLAGWVEIVGGIRMNLYKGITLGWSVRYKAMLHSYATDKSFLWYVPGYGESSSSSFGFNYTIGYTF